ncbi:MAG: hypothetical protein LQ337_002186 [Flavoplaca oasis]|nr:MAG: hypothetical protein LQ337_002186 [Flavoplaca oasis]
MLARGRSEVTVTEDERTRAYNLLWPPDRRPETTHQLLDKYRGQESLAELNEKHQKGGVSILRIEASHLQSFILYTPDKSYGDSTQSKAYLTTAIAYVREIEKLERKLLPALYKTYDEDWLDAQWCRNQDLELTDRTLRSKPDQGARLQRGDAISADGENTNEQSDDTDRDFDTDHTGETEYTDDGDDTNGVALVQQRIKKVRLEAVMMLEMDGMVLPEGKQRTLI